MRNWLGILTLVGLTWVSTAIAAEGPLLDRAHFFSEAGAKQAMSLIEELRQDHRVDVRVETFETVPDGKAESLKQMNQQQRSNFFADWLKTLARDRNAEGVFVLICREPSHLRIGISKALHQRGFTDAHRDQALKPLLAGFQSKQYDQALVKSLEVIRDKSIQLKRSSAVHVGSQPRAVPHNNSSPGLFGLLFWVVGGLIVILFLVNIVASLFRSSAQGPMGGGYGGGYGYGPGWGGGWGSSLLSGFGGAILGNWVYDQFSNRSLHASEHDNVTGLGSSQDDGYQDFSSGGGDFGDSSGSDYGGGGDFSGGDSFGGGDFGGGDFGGGGDF